MLTCLLAIKPQQLCELQPLFGMQCRRCWRDQRSSPTREGHAYCELPICVPCVMTVAVPDRPQAGGSGGGYRAPGGAAPPALRAAGGPAPILPTGSPPRCARRRRRRRHRLRCQTFTLEMITVSSALDGLVPCGQPEDVGMCQCMTPWRTTHHAGRML